VLDVIEIELTRVRRLAQRAHDDFLLYLIDMAIIEAHARARSRRESSEAINRETPDRDVRSVARETTADLRIVS
jgi:hypothetical protein